MGCLINAPDEKPKITWPLLRRVLHYAQPYHWLIVGMLQIPTLDGATHVTQRVAGLTGAQP